MSRTDKPYRRFRARGSGSGGGMDELHRLVESERGVGGGRRAGVPPTPGVAVPSPQTPPPSAPPPPAQDRGDDRRRRRALARVGRPWWSLRGLGPAGWIGRSVLVLLAAVLVWGVAGYLELRSAVAESNGRIQRGLPGALSPQSGGMLSTPTNVLIVGSDALPGQTRSRADTILVMRLDPDSGRIKYLTIPRDFRVTIGRLGPEKINASLAVAGQAGVVRAVRRLTGLPIHHIMVVNFRGFPRLVDQVGGVTVVNPTAITNCPYPGGRSVSFPQGRIELNGADALVFVRVRKCDNDFARGARQQALLAGLRTKVLSPTSLWKAPWNGADMVRALTTDMGVDELVKFGWLQARLEQRPEDRIILAGTPQTIGGVSYVVGDPDRNLEQIRQFVSTDR